MSLRPSSTRSSLTLLAADSVSWIIVAGLRGRGRMVATQSIPVDSTSTPQARSFLPELRRLAAGGSEQLVRREREHGGRRPPRGPPLVVREEVAIDEHPELLRVAEGRRAADAVPGRRAGLLGVGAPDLG